LVTQDADQNTRIESVERHSTVTPKYNSWPPTIPEYSPDLPDFFGPFQSWRTASVASVEQYRCLNSLGVR
ncbi:hypothetical protein KPA94_34175, partial [Burkholderia semiarida]|uniref:hypothetical protein n=1 Tax=Burkholderia semiarida TaxID=2843303 RepID=UPI0023DD861B